MPDQALLPDNEGVMMRVLFFCREEARVEQLALALRLRWQDMKSSIISLGAVGLDLIEHEEFDLIMLCQDTSDMSIRSIIKEVRRFSDVPIVVATDEDSEVEVVKALELGADLYIRTPCELMEVMARVVAMVRRVGLAKRQSDETPIRCGNLLINPATYEVFLGSDPLLLTPTEFKLLYLLAKNRHTTLSQKFIQRFIWDDDVEAEELLKKYIQRLRRKLNDDASNPTWIRTVHGFGYRFASRV